MNTLKKHAVEAVAAIWITIIAVQYLSRYFIPALGEVGLTRWIALAGSEVSIRGFRFAPVYIGMLCLTVMVAGVRALSSHGSQPGRR